MLGYNQLKNLTKCNYKLNINNVSLLLNGRSETPTDIAMVVVAYLFILLNICHTGF